MHEFELIKIGTPFTRSKRQILFIYKSLTTYETYCHTFYLRINTDMNRRKAQHNAKESHCSHLRRVNHYSLYLFTLHLKDWPTLTVEMTKTLAPTSTTLKVPTHNEANGIICKHIWQQNFIVETQPCVRCLAKLKFYIAI